MWCGSEIRPRARALALALHTSEASMAATSPGSVLGQGLGRAGRFHARTIVCRVLEKKGAARGDFRAVHIRGGQTAGQASSRAMDTGQAESAAGFWFPEIWK